MVEHEEHRSTGQPEEVTTTKNPEKAVTPGRVSLGDRWVFLNTGSPLLLSLAGVDLEKLETQGFPLSCFSPPLLRYQ